MRALQIGWVGINLALFAIASRFWPNRWPRDTLPHRVRMQLEQLGPTFVKLGQTLSQRSDLIPPDWLTEFQHLQEGAAGFAPELAVREIETAFKKPIGDIFADFQLQPIAAASVAQVHRAQLKDGTEVVVKVLRPGVRRKIDQDMKILLAVLWIGSCIWPRLARQRPLALVREIMFSLRKETDLREEADNIRRFAFAFRDSTSVYIPNTPAGLSAETVLVQHLSGGRHLNDDALLQTDGPRLASIFIGAYLEQLFQVGFFHADPHPGNLIAMDDGRLCFLDFGIVGFLNADSRRALASLIQAVAQRDPIWVVQAAAELGLLARGTDLNLVRCGVEPILADLAVVPLEKLSLASFFFSISRLGGPGSLTLPPQLAILIRTLFAAEGTLRLLNPNLNIFNALHDIDASALKADLWSPRHVARLKWEAALFVRSLPAKMADTLRQARQPHAFASQSLAEPVTDVDRIGRAADRIAVAIVTLGLYISASLLARNSIGPHILGDLPLLSAGGYVLALGLTAKLVHGSSRMGAI